VVDAGAASMRGMTVELSRCVDREAKASLLVFHRPAVSTPSRAPQRLGAGEAGAQTAALGVDY
jgi:hypothetical protein